jgi:RNA polymerase sigma factor (sigma-70 family)
VAGAEFSDEALVAATRAGDDFAFERLYNRYQRRIAAYVHGMVHDHGRAEDITQEVFMSALRRMRETERPIVFKPWVYEIAKNACIDAFRRSRRAEEISYDAEEGLGGSDYGRLVSSSPTPDAAVDTRMSLDHLRGAFGGLSEMHHDILVMRELEGLSYREIGQRLGMSRPSVESTLFRARRRLTEEYEELASGERCRSVQGLIADAGGRRMGIRDERKMARHVSYCQPCRRAAYTAGFDVAALAAQKSVRAKVAALLPLPAFLRRRWIGGGSDGSDGGSSSLGHWSATLGQHADSLGGWAKAGALAAAVAAAGVGAGVATSRGDSTVKAPKPAAAGAPAGAASGAAAAKSAAARTTRATGTAASPRRSASPASSSSSPKRRHDSRSRRAGAGGSGGSGGSHATGGGGSSATGSTGSAGSSAGSTRPARSSGGGSKPVDTVKRTVANRPVSAPQVPAPKVSVPKVQAPKTGNSTVDNVTGAATSAVNNVTGAATGAVNDAAAAATGAVNGVTSTATGAVNEVVSTAANAVSNPVGTVTDAVTNPRGTVGGVLPGG